MRWVGTPWTVAIRKYGGSFGSQESGRACNMTINEGYVAPCQNKTMFNTSFNIGMLQTWGYNVEIDLLTDPILLAVAKSRAGFNRLRYLYPQEDRQKQAKTCAGGIWIGKLLNRVKRVISYGVMRNLVLNCGNDYACSSVNVDWIW